MIVLAIAAIVAASSVLDVAHVDMAIAFVGAPTIAALLYRSAARASGRGRVIWLLLALHMTLIASADITTLAMEWVGRADSGFILPDVLYVVAYVPWAVAIALIATLVHAIRLQDVLIDASAVAIVAGLAIFQLFVIAPGAFDDPSWTSAAYPAGDVLVVGSIAVVIFAKIRLQAAAGFLMAYGVGTLTLDLAVMWANVSPNAPTWVVPFTEVGYVMAYGLLGAAAVLPGGLNVDRGPRDEHGSVPRLALLGLAVITAPSLAVVLSVARGRVSMPLLVGAALGVSLLVVARLASLVRRLEVEQRRLSATEAHLAFQATHDTLTGLPNRALVTDRLAQEVARAHADGRELTLMFIDVDDFKLVNDTLGHAAGDDLLRTVAHRIQDEIGVNDIIGRVGGDEFVIVSPDLTDRRSAWRFAETILAAVCKPIPVDRQIIEPSVSIGVALRGTVADPQALLANADLALYKAKDAGRSCARLFDQSLRLAAHERAGIEIGLRRAVGMGEIGVEYQPRVSLSDGRLSSLEALARWPRRPDISVGRFIEVAENTGIVEQLGREVLERACADIMRINRARDDDPIGLSVNVSMRQLMQPNLVEIVEGALVANAMPRDLLSLEITETFVAREPDFAAHTLSAVRELGVRIEIDDFGVGHTSFKRLSSLPIDGIKIDRSLAHGLRTHEATEPIVNAIVAMARALGMCTTVEGIEQIEDLDIIRSIGCDFGQGFLFSRPIPFETVSSLVATWPGLCPAAADLRAAHENRSHV